MSGGLLTGKKTKMNDQTTNIICSLEKIHSSLTHMFTPECTSKLMNCDRIQTSC